MENLSWRSVDVSLERPIDYQELNGVYAKFGKRLFDIVFVLLLFPVALPVTGLLWALTKCDGGPRPIIEAELVKYGGYQWAYLAATPGVTGVWQVSGRNDVSYDERVRMDAEYLEKRSFLFDCAIMLKTVSAVLNRTGK